MSPARQRPRCFLNVAASLDGKIASTSREMPKFPSPRDRQMMDEIRARADAVLISGGTLRAADYPLTIRSPRLRRDRKKAGKPENPLNILLSASLDVPIRGRFFGSDVTQRLVVTSRSAPATRVRKLQSRADWLLLGGGGRGGRRGDPGKKEPERVDLVRMMAKLAGMGIRELLLEGGGATNFQFFQKGWVDEIYLTLCPVVIGGVQSPTPADGPGFSPSRFRNYELMSLRRAGSEVFLHYRARAGARR